MREGAANQALSSGEGLGESPLYFFSLACR